MQEFYKKQVKFPDQGHKVKLREIIRPGQEEFAYKV